MGFLSLLTRYPPFRLFGATDVPRETLFWINIRQSYTIEDLGAGRSKREDLYTGLGAEHYYHVESSIDLESRIATSSGRQGEAGLTPLLYLRVCKKVKITVRKR